MPDFGDHATTPGQLRSRADRRRDALLGDETDRRRPLTGRPGRPAVPARPAEPELPAGRARPDRPEAPAARSRPAAPPPVPVRTPSAPANGATRQAPAPPRPAPRLPATPPVAAPVVPPTAARLPAPPPAAAPAPRARPAAPLTTVAPFQAVPTPHTDDDAGPAAPPLDPWDQPARPAARGRAPRAAAPRAAAPRAAPVAPQPAAPPTAPAPPPVPAGATASAVTSAPAGQGSPPYRDWTRPGGAGTPAPATEAIPDREVARGRAAAPVTEAIPDRGIAAGRAAAPLTEAIPDRAPARDRDRTDRDDRGRDRAPREEVDTGSTGVVGNRAAMRAERQAREAERQAMETERRKAARRAGVSRAALRAADDGDAPPRRGRAGLALLAVVVVALVVLGVYSFTSPAAQEPGTTTTPTPTTSAPASVAPPSGALPPLSVDPLPPVGQAPSTPVRVPVTVLNATDVGGLAGDAAEAFSAQGWQPNGIGEYDGTAVAVTTVYVTPGDEQQRQSALQLMELFPGVVGGPADRFFEVPDVDGPGLVVVLTGEWQP